MLTIHGNIIISGEVTYKQTYQYSTYLNFPIASDNGDGTTTRYQLGLSVPNNKAAEIEEKIQVGKICEIISGSLIDVKNTLPNEAETSQVNLPQLKLRVKLENFKFLGPCVYYEELKGITK